MAITHFFVSQKQNGVDDTVVRPSDWNAEHVIDPEDIVGLQGPPGEQGPPGDKGATGDTGEVGDKGPTGDTGEAGQDGSPGVTGDKGPAGDKGLTGDKGQDGDRGPMGYQGPPGETGADGDTGETGDKGPTGDTGETGDKGATGDQGEPGANGISYYTIQVQALTSSPADGATVYFGMLPKAPTTSADISKVYVRKAGTIKIAEIYCYSGTAGTNENWSLYIRKNNSADTLIATLGVNTKERVFSNAGLDIAMSAGDYFEIKGIQPTWATNPLTTIYGGYVYVEV